jgi:signal peptidase II
VKRHLELWIVGMVAVLDQVTKAAVAASLPLHDTVTIIPGLLNLTHVRNTGAAFGLLNTAEFAYKPVVMTLLAFAALGGVALYATQLPKGHLWARAGLGLVLGGAVGNLVDRARQGYVVDFVDAYWGGWHFWAFNVADTAITVGVGLLILDLLRPTATEPAQAATPGT